jgi:hypothetical protein
MKITQSLSDLMFVCDFCGRTYNQTLLKQANAEGKPIQDACSYPISAANPTGGCFESLSLTEYVPVKTPTEAPAVVVAEMAAADVSESGPDVVQ